MRCISVLAGAGALAMVATLPALAQGPLGSAGQRGVIIQNQPNSTGNGADAVISRGATGADTITTNSAAGGNASRPEQAFPNGSANGGGGSGR